MTIIGNFEVTPNLLGMKNLNDQPQDLQPLQPAPDSAGTPLPDEAPLDAVAVNNHSYQEPDLRQANLVLAESLDLIDVDLANALRLCADRHRSCNRRFCPRCVRARTGRLGSNYKVRLDRMIAPHHLTLTSYPVALLTRAALKDLRARFRLLRLRMKAEKKISVLGGVANVEIDATEDGRWLIGLHAVIDAPVPPSENWVRENWQALGGGQQVRLDPIVMGTQGTVFAYSTKFATLPSDEVMLRQFITGTKGFRATMPFGSAHALFGKAPRRRAPAEVRP